MHMPVGEYLICIPNICILCNIYYMDSMFDGVLVLTDIVLDAGFVSV